VAAFRDRSLAGQAFRYLFLDATYCKARVDHRVVSQAVVVATGVAADGHREEAGSFCTIASSNLDAIPVGSKVVYAEAATATGGR
jgi:transposase-like protein